MIVTYQRSPSLNSELSLTRYRISAYGLLLFIQLEVNLNLRIENLRNGLNRCLSIVFVSRYKLRLRRNCSFNQILHLSLWHVTFLLVCKLQIAMINPCLTLVLRSNLTKNYWINLLRYWLDVFSLLRLLILFCIFI